MLFYVFRYGESITILSLVIKCVLIQDGGHCRVKFLNVLMLLTKHGRNMITICFSMFSDMGYPFKYSFRWCIVVKSKMAAIAGIGIISIICHKDTKQKVVKASIDHLEYIDSMRHLWLKEQSYKFQDVTDWLTAMLQAHLLKLFAWYKDCKSN